MARVHHRKARKDYPDHGIKKGDMYYTTKIKTGQYSSRTIRQLEPIKQSQMTSSAFKSAVFGLQESTTEFTDHDGITAAAEAVREIGEEEREKLESMPEGLQQGDTGQLLEERADSCDRVADELDDMASQLENLEKPDEPELDEPDPDSDEWGDWTTAQDDYQTELAEYEEEFERITSEAVDQLAEIAV